MLSLQQSLLNIQWQKVNVYIFGFTYKKSSLHLHHVSHFARHTDSTRQKKKKKKSFPQFFLLLLLLWIDIFGSFKKAWQNECKNLPVLCACMSVTIFFFFPAALIQSKNNNTSRNQEIDSRNTVIPYIERMNHTQKETSDRCAFIKV